MSNKIAKKVVMADAIVFEWADGEVTTVSLSDLPKALIERAALHGLSQKLGDSYSGADGNVRIARAAFEEVFKALKGGDWNRKGGSTGGIWVEALARAAGVELDEALAKWTAMSDDEKAAIRKHPHVKVAKAEIEAERASKAADDAPALEL